MRRFGNVRVFRFRFLKKVFFFQLIFLWEKKKPVFRKNDFYSYQTKYSAKNKNYPCFYEPIADFYSIYFFWQNQNGLGFLKKRRFGFFKFGSFLLKTEPAASLIF